MDLSSALTLSNSVILSERSTAQEDVLEEEHVSTMYVSARLVSLVLIVLYVLTHLSHNLQVFI